MICGNSNTHSICFKFKICCDDLKSQESIKIKNIEYSTHEKRAIEFCIRIQGKDKKKKKNIKVGRLREKKKKEFKKKNQKHTWSCMINGLPKV